MRDALLVLYRSFDVFPFILRCSSEPNSMKLPFLLGKSEGSSSLVRRKSGGSTDLHRTYYGLSLKKKAIPNEMTFPL
jgi:hypothetical protein